MSEVLENEQSEEEESDAQSIIEENFFNYLKELDEQVWERLFRVKACLVALFRSLGELEKLIIFRLLHIDQSISEKPLRLWMRSHSIADLKHSLALLQSYKIITVLENTTNDEKQQYKLNDGFKNGFVTLLSEDPSYKYSYELVKLESILAKSNKSKEPTKNSDNSYDDAVKEDHVSKTAEKAVENTAEEMAEETPRNKNKSVITLDDLVKHAKLKLDFILLFLVSPEARKGTMLVNKLLRKIKRLKKQSDETKNDKKIENLEAKFNRLSKNSGVISQDLLQILRRFGMVDPAKKNYKSSKTVGTKMSRQTLSWLLKDVTSQMTSLLVGHLQNLDNGYLTNCKSMNRTSEDSKKSSLELKEASMKTVTESVELLLSLSQASCGDCFSTEGLTKTQIRLLRLLNELGIVYYKNPKRFYLYDLSYIVGKTNTNSVLPNSKDLDISIKAGNDSRIIVQSNFKVYVYTASPLQISVLSHLCELQARTPNLVVGVLTRESVQSAFKSGITSKEIIRFLSPSGMNSSIGSQENTLLNSSFTYTIPENVCRQLKMWESERDRIELCPSIVFKRWDQDFMPDLFQRTVRWAQSKRYELFYTQWPSDPHSPEYHDWISKEKYLACNLEFKEEVINQIRLIRADISAERQAKIGSG